MNQTIVKKTSSEKALFKVIKKNYNAEKRKMNSTFSKKNSSMGLIGKSLKDIPEMLKLADAIELENLKS